MSTWHTRWWHSQRWGKAQLAHHCTRAARRSQSEQSRLPTRRSRRVHAHVCAVCWWIILRKPYDLWKITPQNLQDSLEMCNTGSDDFACCWLLRDLSQIFNYPHAYLHLLVYLIFHAALCCSIYQFNLIHFSHFCQKFRVTQEKPSFYFNWATHLKLLNWVIPHNNHQEVAGLD